MVTRDDLAGVRTFRDCGGVALAEFLRTFVIKTPQPLQNREIAD